MDIKIKLIEFFIFQFISNREQLWKYLYYRMLKKLLSNGRTSAYNLLKKLNVSIQDVQYHTEYNNLFILLKKHNESAPEPNDFIKVMTRKTKIEVGYLLKKAVVAHYFVQHNSQIKSEEFTILLNFLINECEQWSNTVNKEENKKIALTQIYQKNKNLCFTEPDQEQKRVNEKEKFILTGIIRPYLFYIKKLWLLGSDTAKQDGYQTCKVWSVVNMLNLINGFSNNFVAVGRYFIQDYGALIIFLTEALAFDILKMYKVLTYYIKSKTHLICVKGGNREQLREAQEFSHLIEEVSLMNQKLVQVYMSKYFYQFLEHLEQPEWIDTNSSEFDRIFKGSNKQNNGEQPIIKRGKKMLKR